MLDRVAWNRSKKNCWSAFIDDIRVLEADVFGLHHRPTHAYHPRAMAGMLAAFHGYDGGMDFYMANKKRI
jgi:hypothetical protein